MRRWCDALPMAEYFRGQMGVVPNHALCTAVDIRSLENTASTDQWLTVALMGGFARKRNKEITILGNDAEIRNDSDPQEAQSLECLKLTGVELRVETRN
ncbi:hypothetical protein C4D60_Mb00t17260 [Musa balbisiana]|uniref:ATP synthase F1 complex delta/epsilon subunit N-terminal domain-containing protein n=1 Tax=Musa balbisiana TaxID=52838 RepID=A0A4S8I6P5_MUSBA|nr:hypothetical protein C4D60_Mb00t17260 [Musa balbisiana]